MYYVFILNFSVTSIPARFWAEGFTSGLGCPFTMEKRSTLPVFTWADVFPRKKWVVHVYHYWTTSCLAYCCIFIYFNSVYTLSATSRVVLLFLSLHCSAINTSLSVKLEDLLLYRSNCTSLLLQLNKQPRLTVIYQVMPDWLNRLICLAFMRFLEWLKSFESMAFFGSHLSLWVVLSSFFDNFPFCLYFEEPTTVKQAADDSYWIRHPKCSRIPRPRKQESSTELIKTRPEITRRCPE